MEDLEYNDITSFFIEEKEESNKIEFKSFANENGDFNRKLDGVIRAICAFLNSEGGILIWGAPIGQIVAGRNEKIFCGELSPLSELKEKDWLINKISDLITPLPIGVKVKILNQGVNYLYIFEIQKSSYCPHQFKNTYLARLDGQTKPAPHYLIEALFRKITYPNLEAYIKLNSCTIQGSFLKLRLSIFIFNFSELQNEEDVSFRLMCPQGIFVRSQEPQFQEMYDYDGHQLIFKDIDILHFGAPNAHHEEIAINRTQLTTIHNNKVELFLSVGGRKSPLKFCDYTLDFARLQLNSTYNPNDLIVTKEENVLSSEKQLESSKTKEEILKEILDR